MPRHHARTRRLFLVADGLEPGPVSAIGPAYLGGKYAPFAIFGDPNKPGTASGREVATVPDPTGTPAPACASGSPSATTSRWTASTPGTRRKASPFLAADWRHGD